MITLDSGLLFGGHSVYIGLLVIVYEKQNLC